MATINLVIKYGVNQGLILSPEELIEQYLFGIPLCKYNGEAISYDALKQILVQSQDWIETWLSIKLNKQIVEDNTDFDRSSFNNWGNDRTTWLIKSPLSLIGFINTVQQIIYPLQWISARRSSDERLMSRNIAIVPAGTTAANTNNAVVFSGIVPQVGFLGLPSIPNYWKITYITGFNNIPPALYNIVGKLAAIQVLAILGDLLLGIGKTSQSLSMDGLSQSTSIARNASAGLFNARITQYGSEIFGKDGSGSQPGCQLKLLKDTFKGIIFTAL